MIESADVVVAVLDGFDNDGDGATDCADPSCELTAACEGGGGGCSVASASVNKGTSASNMLIMLLPMLVIGIRKRALRAISLYHHKHKFLDLKDSYATYDTLSDGNKMWRGKSNLFLLPRLTCAVQPERVENGCML